MELTAEEQHYLQGLEQEGGKKWEQFRARRNQWIRKGKSDEWATWRSLQTAKQSNVINLSVKENTDSFNSEDWMKFYICLALWIPLFLYQLGIHAETFGSGVEGYFVAISLELILAFLSVLQLNSLHHEIMRWITAIAVMAFMAMSIIGISSQRVKLESEEYKRLSNEYSLLEENYKATSEKSVSARRKLIRSMQETSRKMLEIERKPTGNGFGIEISDLNVQVRLIFLLAQVIISHVLGRVLFGRDMS